MSKHKRTASPESPRECLETLVEQALYVARTARRNRASLAGNNFYADKLASLRADATNMFRELPSASVGDSSALAELIERVFAPSTRHSDRGVAVRNALYSLRTTWRSAQGSLPDESGLFPLSILSDTERGYLVSVARQMNGCFSAGWYDASAVMMRRLLEVCIIEAFEAKGISAKIKNSAGDYLQLSELVRLALDESSWTLSRVSKKALPRLRDAGHNSAHGRYYHARREDIENLRHDCRIVVEEFLHHAGLL